MYVSSFSIRSFNEFSRYVGLLEFTYILKSEYSLILSIKSIDTKIIPVSEYDFSNPIGLLSVFLSTFTWFPVFPGISKSIISPDFIS